MDYYTNRIGQNTQIAVLYNFKTDDAMLDGFELEVKGVCRRDLWRFGRCDV